MERRNIDIEKKYIHNIAELADLPVEKVKEVFEYYVLYLLHEVAIAEKPKGSLQIYLPCFCSLSIKENVVKNAKNKLRIAIRPETRDKYITKKLEDAYFRDKDLLISNLEDKFSKILQNELYEKVKKEFDE